MPETTTPRLTESEVSKIEARLKVWDETHRGYPASWQVVSDLVRDWRALQARIETLTTDWCECGHSRDKHQFFNDHDECYECDQASPDLCCEWRPAPRPNENAALREQLARAESEVRGVLEALGPDVVHAHPGGGDEDIFGSLAISVLKLQKERDRLRGRDAALTGDMLGGL